MSALVAIVTCAGDDVDPDSPVLLAALRERGLDARVVVWNDPLVNWGDFDLTVVRSTWDYARSYSEFMQWAASVPNLCNSLPSVRWSSDKHYLGDLAEAGVLTIATTFCQVGEVPSFPQSSFVVKPCIGAGSMDVERYEADDSSAARAQVSALHASGRDVIIQPYVRSVDESGEVALVFIDGEFAHAMRKGAMLNVTQLDRNDLFRREQMSLISVEPEVVAVGRAALAATGFSDLLYARVDLVADDDGWAIMEVELVEPSLFLTYSPDTVDRLALAILKRLGLRQ